jgi:hypothetical protein
VRERFAEREHRWRVERILVRFAADSVGAEEGPHRWPLLFGFGSVAVSLVSVVDGTGAIGPISGLTGTVACVVSGSMMRISEESETTVTFC